MKHLKMLSFGIIWFAILPFQIAYAYETHTYIVKRKLADPSIAYQNELNSGGNGAYHIPQKRDITLRDSGRAQSLMFIKNTNFRYIGNVGFYIPQLSIGIVPNDPASPARFDDPTSFSLHVHQGSIVLSETALNALFNKQVFAVPGAVIKDVNITTEPGVMTLQGLMYRGEWIPFVMKGGITLREGHYLDFKPTTVIVDGIDTSKVLSAANVKLDELLKINLAGVKLIGSTIILDTEKLFPPPRLYMKVINAKLETKGLVLEFDDGHSYTFAKPIAPTSSHLIVRGGDLKIMRVMPLNVTLQIDSEEPNKDLDFCLYRYRNQLIQGSMTLTCNGDIHAFFPKPDCAY